MKIRYSIIIDILTLNTKTIDIEINKFPCGDLNVRLPEEISEARSLVLDVKLRNSDDILQLLMVVDAINNIKKTDINLLMMYVPYSRQDRVCNAGEAFSSRVFLQLIDNLGFKSITILDPHSDVIGAVLNTPVHFIETQHVVQACFSLTKQILGKCFTLVAPDMGATKKMEKFCLNFKHNSFIQGTKNRDLKTGRLNGFGYYGDARGQDLLIIDDICDGGGTFIGLTKELLKGGANSVSLYVNHGIFSKGIDILIDNGIKEIWTTNSYCELEHEKLTIIKL